jgi:hypothetical protein
MIIRLTSYSNHEQGLSRDIFYDHLHIEQGSDMAEVQTVPFQVIEDWRAIEISGPGPDINNIKFDWITGKKSAWNSTIISYFAEKLKEQVQEKWTQLPNYDIFYYEETCWSKFKNLCTRWRNAQRKTIAPGILETDEQTESRINEMAKKQRKLARQNTRRRSVSRLTSSFAIY